MNTNKSIKYLLVTFFFFSLYGCWEKQNWYSKIYIQNNLGKAIYYRFSFAYPDTLLKNDGEQNYKVSQGLKVDETATVFAYNPTIQIFILDANVVEHEPWDSIVIHNKILRRYQFTKNDMEKINWTVIYP